jgi:hypothetical protein
MFKTKLIGLAGAALTFSGMAFGQLCATNNTATVPSLSVTGTNNIRQEGLTELLPVMTVSCASQGTGSTTFNLQVQITTTPITSAVTSASTGKTEIALTGGGITNNNNNVVYATVSNNVAQFTGVTATLTGTTNTFTVSYIRVNASVLGSSGAFPTAITAQAFISGTTNSNSGISNSTTVAYAQNALISQSKVYQTLTTTTFTSGNNSIALPTGVGSSGVASVGATAAASPNYQVCTGQNSGSTTTAPSYYVQVSEGFSGAWKTKADETGGSATAATSGTRIKLVFSNVPTGLNIYVPLSATTLNAYNQTYNATGSPLVATLTTSETGAFTAATAVTSPSSVAGMALLPVSGTTATAIYEITADNLNGTDTLEIPVSLGAAANSVTNYLTNPTLTVTTSLAPQSATASQIPSFVSTAADISTINTVKFTPCQTNLLFPFVTNANGFETGIAISNTTKDPFGTTTQSGTCTLNYYSSGVSGATNPTAVTAPNLAEGTNQPYLAGETYAFTLTQSLGVNTANPATFQGYIIAQCNFVDAHAFAYILGGLQPGMFVNPNNTAMGYLALVLGRSTGTVEGVSF